MKKILLLVTLSAMSLFAFAQNVTNNTESSASDKKAEKLSHKQFTDNKQSTFNIVEGMKYEQYKDFYKDKTYFPQVGDPYNRVLAGIASFFIPGLGHVLMGETGRGIKFFLAGPGSMALGFGLVLTTYLLDIICQEASIVTGIGAFCCFVAVPVINIWSVFDAVKVAKIKNMYFHDLQKRRYTFDMKLQPYLAYSRSSIKSISPSAGLSLRINF